jgi:23S rRNA (guanosine2251-2'-O)-methyltransferase
MNNSEAYESKKAFFDSMLTIYGRKPVLEALQDPNVSPFRLHLADSNKAAGVIKDITDLATRKGAEVLHHNRDALSRLSRNRKQDQGVVLDIAAPRYRPILDLDAAQQENLIALENVTNPQNIGMIIRSVGASPMAGVIIPRKGCAPIDALVIKASAGNVFKTAIFHCEQLMTEISELKGKGYKLIGLTGEGAIPLRQASDSGPCIFILGNETEGLSREMIQQCDELVHIPMQAGWDSLNVSVATGVVLFEAVRQRIQKNS